MTFENIISDLKNKIYYPIYFLSGEEPYYIDEISDYIENNVLNETEKEFNQTIVYGKDIDVITLKSIAKRYPMMANYQVVIVKEAQEINKIEELNSYLDNVQPTTILVICYKYKKIDGRTSFKKNLDKKGIFFESKKLYDNQLPEWIINYLKNIGYKISEDAAKLLADNLGDDLSKIVNEILKLTINVPVNSFITPEIIERNIGISKDFNVFELQKALGKKDIFKSNQIINYFASNPKDNPLVKIIPILYSYFNKTLTYQQLADKSLKNIASVLGVSTHYVKDYENTARKYNTTKLFQIISLLREYDLKSKGVDSINVEDSGLMKELIYKILH